MELSELDDGNDDFFSQIDIEDLVLKQTEKKKTPMELVRPRFFFVTDFVAHTWCPQKAFLAAVNPNHEEIMQEMHSEMDPTIQPVMKLGSAFHEKRELEVHGTKTVKVSRAEDKFAIKLLNVHTLLRSLLLGKPLEREIPVFGMPLNLGVVVFGIIDEVRLDLSTGTITLSETKTRNTQREPFPAQKVGHDLQIMLYRCLFADLIQGKIQWDLILNILRLNKTVRLSETIRREIAGAGLKADNLDSLYRGVMNVTRALPANITLNVEYLYQKTGQTFLTQTVEYNEPWLYGQMREFVRAWSGGTEIVGTSVQDAWKCRSCYFADMCDWRMAQCRLHLSTVQRIV